MRAAAPRWLCQCGDSSCPDERENVRELPEQGLPEWRELEQARRPECPLWGHSNGGRGRHTDKTQLHVCTLCPAGAQLPPAPGRCPRTASSWSLSPLGHSPFSNEKYHVHEDTSRSSAQGEARPSTAARRCPGQQHPAQGVSQVWENRGQPAGGSRKAVATHSISCLGDSCSWVSRPAFQAWQQGVAQPHVPTAQHPALPQDLAPGATRASELWSWKSLQEEGLLSGR